MGSDLANMVTYNTSNYYYTLISGDLNGDGMLDLVAGYFASQWAPAPGMDVFYGLTDGGLSEPVHYDQTDGWSLAIGDIDGDGLPDLIVSDTFDADAGQYSLNVLLNSPDGGFRPPNAYLTQSAVQGIGVGDFDGDGRADVVVGLYADSVVSSIRGGAEVFHNIGGGQFGSGQQISGDGSFFEIELVVDLNQDGYPDIVLPSSDGLGVLVLLNDTVGSFSSTSYYPNPEAVFPFAPRSILAVPSASGAPDLILGSWYGVQTLINDGNAHFHQGPSYSSPGYALVTADFNGDGLPDLAGMDSVLGITVLYGASDGGYEGTASFAPDSNFACGIALLGPVDAPRAIAAAVFGRDGGIAVLGDAAKH